MQAFNTKASIADLKKLSTKEVYGMSMPRGRIYDRNYNIIVDNVGTNLITYKKESGTSVEDEINYAYKLAEKIEVSPRMIKTYKTELEQAGIYIDTINGIYGGYVYNHKNNYDVSFSIQDVNCIEKIIPLLDLKNRNDVEKLLEKIKTIVIRILHL